MNRLPQEIIDSIVGYLLPEKNRWSDCETATGSKVDSVAAYASLSRSFQHAVERVTFRNIKIKSTELGRFKDVFQNKSRHRRILLKGLYMTIILPDYGDKYCARVERAPDQQANNEAFTEAVATLFDFLVEWIPIGENTGEKPKILLDIGAVSSGDAGYRPQQYDTEGKRRYSVDSIDGDIKDERWRRSYLAIDNIDKIKGVQCITQFRCQQYSQSCSRFATGCRSFEPASIVKLATRMPQLEYIDWNFRDDEKWTRFVNVRQQRRYDFARSLYHLPLQQLTSFFFGMLHMTPNNQSWQNASFLHPSDPETDWLSMGLHYISQAPNLRTFIVERFTVLSPTLLWPQSLSEGSASNDSIDCNAVSSGSLPYWPALQQFLITASQIAPNGSWLFDGTPSNRPDNPHVDFDDFVDLDGSDSDEPDVLNEKIEGIESGHLPTWRFRDTLQDSTLERWVKAMASAITQMPKLKRGVFTMTLNWELDVREAKDFRVNVEFDSNHQGIRQWVFRMGVDLKYNLDPTLFQLLDEVSGRADSVQVTSESERVNGLDRMV